MTDMNQLGQYGTLRSQRWVRLKLVFYTNSSLIRAEQSKESSHTTSSEGKSAIKADITRSWYQTFDSSDGLLFWSRKDPVDVSTLHPGPIQIFRIWQLYLDNVNPLLKVLHGPSVQLRVIEAASNLGNISPSFEALLFAIYCTSISSLAKDDCQAMFDLPREDLMARYQYGCQQALMNAKFLRSADREVLTALYLYLVSSLTRRLLYYLLILPRSPSIMAQTLALYPLYSPWRFVMRSVCHYIARQPIASAPSLKLR